MIELVITYSEVAKQVRRTLEYEGKKNGAFDQVRAIEQDKEKLLQYWHDGLTEVNNLLDRVIVRFATKELVEDDDEVDCDVDLSAGMHEDTDEDEEDYFAEIDEAAYITLSSNNDGVKPLLRKAILKVLETHIVSRWLSIVSPDMLVKYDGRMAEELDRLQRLAYYREMP